MPEAKRTVTTACQVRKAERLWSWVGLGQSGLRGVYVTGPRSSVVQLVPCALGLTLVNYKAGIF